MKTINDRIDHVRVTLGYPINQFAKKIGSSLSAAVNVLGDKKDDPSMKMVKNICKVFPVNERWLLVGDGKPFTQTDLSSFKYTKESTHEIDLGIIDRVKMIRKGLGLSQALFASEIGMTRDSLAFMENNRSALQINAFKRIVMRFRVSCEWLLLGAGPRYRKA
jgi:DNA-binding XRE family transcriptional regulator